MKSKIQASLMICVIILMVFVLMIAGPRNPKLAISYLSQTNEAGNNLAFFVITNVGNVTLNIYRSGGLEIYGRDRNERVGCETKLPRLEPGGADIATVYLPASVESRWRFIIFFSSEGPGNKYGHAKFFAKSDWIK
jgi:hypothetical protein